MKKLTALLLCCVMPLLLLSGCKKDEVKAVELSNSQISSDLIAGCGHYNMTFAENNYSISDLKILDKKETDEKEGKTTDLTVSAVATNACVRIELEAEMTYALHSNVWELEQFAVTKSTHTPIGAPNQESVLMALSNYTSITGGALAIKGDERHNLKFNVLAATWESKFDAETKTATLHAALKNDEMEFTGYYKLTFKETGWEIESEKQENGQLYPVLYLEKLDLKSTKK